MVKKRKGNTILCIEDETDIRSFACKVLNLEGYHCIQAETSEKALGLLEEESIDLVLLDLKHIGSAGWQILESIKNNPETSGTPVIVCTTSFGQLHQERALSMGAVDYLFKPLSANALRKAVSRVLPKKDKRLEH